MIRAVLDSNVVVSALLVRPAPPALLSAALRRREFTALVSDAMLDELAGVLDRPYFRQKRAVSDQDIHGVLDLLRNDAEIILPQSRIVCIARDPDDDRILECALGGGAGYIVTGDHHLLELRRYQDVRIVTPGEFLAILEAQKQGL